MTTQKELWDVLQARDQHKEEPSGFAVEVLNHIRPNSTILELGCGAGNDSIGFAQAGHTVIATDFSDVAVNKDKSQFDTIPQLSFQLLDMSEPMSFHDQMFDVVYAKLSLHYFSDEVTRKVIAEIHRVLKPEGLLCFICKSVKDPLYGQGVEIERDMFDLNGHIRHFFSETYAHSLLKDKFEIEHIQSGKDIFFERESAYVKVFARAKK